MVRSETDGGSEQDRTLQTDSPGPVTPGPTLLTADLLRSTKPVLETRREPVPEFGKNVVVVISEMTAAERDAWEASIFKPGKRGGGQIRRTNFRSTLLVRCLVDDAGNRILSDNQAGLLAKHGSKVISRLWDIAAELNGIGEDDEEELLGDSKSGD